MKERSWEKVAQWYENIVGEKGHHYHQQVILPKLKNIFEFDNLPNPKFLDLACGNGFLATHLPKGIYYEGIDNSPSLLKEARKKSSHTFTQHDLTKPFSLKTKDFSHIAMILALQNMAEIDPVFQSVQGHLRKDGKFFLILNHPCFRIARQSHWGFDEGKQLQFRRIDRYQSPLRIPIQTPGKGKKQETVTSYHHPLSTYVNALAKAGLGVVQMEEWCSENMSTGGRAKAENRARKEIPLFLLLVATPIDFQTTA